MFMLKADAIFIGLDLSSVRSWQNKRFDFVHFYFRQVDNMVPIEIGLKVQITRKLFFRGIKARVSL